MNNKHYITEVYCIDSDPELYEYEKVCYESFVRMKAKEYISEPFFKIDGCSLVLEQLMRFDKNNNLIEYSGKPIPAQTFINDVEAEIEYLRLEDERIDDNYDNYKKTQEIDFYHGQIT